MSRKIYHCFRLIHVLQSVLLLERLLRRWWLAMLYICLCCKFYIYAKLLKWKTHSHEILFVTCKHTLKLKNINSRPAELFHHRHLDIILTVQLTSISFQYSDMVFKSFWAPPHTVFSETLMLTKTSNTRTHWGNTKRHHTKESSHR